MQAPATGIAVIGKAAGGTVSAVIGTGSINVVVAGLHALRLVHQPLQHLLRLCVLVAQAAAATITVGTMQTGRAPEAGVAVTPEAAADTQHAATTAGVTDTCNERCSGATPRMMVANVAGVFAVVDYAEHCSQGIMITERIVVAKQP